MQDVKIGVITENGNIIRLESTHFTAEPTNGKWIIKREMDSPEAAKNFLTTVEQTIVIAAEVLRLCDDIAVLRTQK